MNGRARVVCHAVPLDKEKVLANCKKGTAPYGASVVMSEDALKQICFVDKGETTAK